MSKTWRIFVYEYLRHVLRRRFLFAILSVPIWLLVIGGIAVLAIVLITNNSPIGYVDYSGLLDNPVNTKVENTNRLIPIDIFAFQSEEEANTALENGKIQAYYVLEADYLETQNNRLVYKEEPSIQVTSIFTSFLRRNLLAHQPKNVVDRVIKGPELVIKATRDNREMRNTEWFKAIAPMAAGILLTIVVFSTGGYLMQAVVEEKENRTMEILATSVSPMQIMSGKILALMAVGMTQVFAWALVPVIGFILAAIYVPSFRAVIDWPLFGLIFLLVFPTFVMISAMMAAIGSTVTEASEGQQITGLLSFPVMAPYFLLGALIANPGSPVAVALSLFPLTSALTILIRLGFSTVPPIQITASVIILMVSAVGSLWLAARIFRLGMLRYGQRLRFKDLLHSMRSPK